MAMPGLQHQGSRISGDRKQAGVAERHEAAITDEHVEGERKDREQQDLTGDVDVIRIADPDR